MDCKWKTHISGTLTEENEINEEGHTIKHSVIAPGIAQADTYFDRDKDGRETLRINPNLSERVQAADPRTGVQTSLQDEDGNKQTWSFTNPVDKYFGNVNTHTDFSGQQTNFKLNNNKTVIAEIGNIDHLVNSRGQENTDGTAPGPRNIRHVLDEADHEVETLDDETHIKTIHRYDKDDYKEAFYFVHTDGHVYQATYTDYDEMHRIAKIYDTRILMKLGYDQNSNRRYARAYLIGESAKDGTEQECFHESWYDYTPGNRPLLRDCVLQEKEIVLSKLRGMALEHENGEVKTQTVCNAEGEKIVKHLTYEEETRLLTNINTNDGATVVIIALGAIIRLRSGSAYL